MHDDLLICFGVVSSSPVHGRRKPLLSNFARSVAVVIGQWVAGSDRSLRMAAMARAGALGA